MERTALLEQALDRCETWYDVTRFDGDEPLKASAAYHERNVGYAISRKAEMWAYGRHEYAYFFSLPELTQETYDACYAQALALGEPLIKPGKDHMCSAVTVVFVCDRVNDDARQKLQRCRFRKSFQFSLQGWMEVRTCAVDMEESAVYANPVGRDMKNFFDRLLHPKKRKRNLIQLLFNRE